MAKWNRRDFLRTTCCSAAAGFAAASFSRFGLVNALAQSATDYKALVCVFLFGGNDSNNMVIPFDATGYGAYKTARGGLALAQGSLLPISPPTPGQPFAFHPRFAGLQSLFNKQQVAVLANVGTLVQPTTRAQFRNGGAPLPINLFSHSDQEAQMQTAILDKVSETGWAGRTADKIQSIYGGNFPIIISLAGTNIFCEGVVAQSIQSNGNPTKLLNGYGGGSESTARLASLQSLLTFDTGLSLIQAASTTTGDAIQNGQALAAALAGGTPLATQFPKLVFRKPIATSGEDHPSASRARPAAPDLLRLDGWLRHAHRPAGPAGFTVQRSQPIPQRLLSSNCRNGCGVQRDYL